MFHRDVMVLGISDGVMCAATGFGLILQKLIFHGYISWNKQGWIVQSVSLASFSLGVLPLKMVDQCSQSTGLGSFIHRWSSSVDSIPRMALDSYCFLRITWSCNDHETAQLCIL